MRKFLLALLVCSAALAQSSQKKSDTVVYPWSTDPAGLPCVAGSVASYKTTGTLYTCQSGVYVLLSGGGGGGTLIAPTLEFWVSPTTSCTPATGTIQCPFASPDAALAAATATAPYTVHIAPGTYATTGTVSIPSNITFLTVYASGAVWNITGSATLNQPYRIEGLTTTLTGSLTYAYTGATESIRRGGSIIATGGLFTSGYEHFFDMSILSNTLITLNVGATPVFTNVVGTPRFITASGATADTVLTIINSQSLASGAYTNVDLTNGGRMIARGFIVTNDGLRANLKLAGSGTSVATGNSLDGVSAAWADSGSAYTVITPSSYIPYLVGTAIHYTGGVETSSSLFGVGGGTAQAQTVTVLALSGVAIPVGTKIRWLPTVANTATNPTLAVNGLAAATIKRHDSGISLIAGDLSTTSIAEVTWNGTYWLLQNPTAFTLSGTGREIPTTQGATVTDMTLLGTTNFGNGTSAGEVKLNELIANGSNYTSWLGPDSRATNLRLLLPQTDPAGQLMLFGTPSSEKSTISWITPAASCTTDTTNADNITSGIVDTARLGSGIPSSSTVLRGDSTWGSVDFSNSDTIQRPNSRRWTYVVYSGNSTPINAIGDVAGTTGTVSLSSATDAEPVLANIIGNATAGSRAELSGYQIYRSQRDLRMQTYVQVPASTDFSNSNLFIGLADGNGTNVTMTTWPVSCRAIGFRAVAGTNTNWQCMHVNGGATPDSYDSGVAVGTTGHSFEIYYDYTNSTPYYYIDGTRVCSSIATTVLPASGYNLRYIVVNRTTEAASKNIRVGWVYVSSSK